MKKPKGYVLPKNEQKVCKFIKSLYRLKQSSKQWHQKVRENIVILLCLYVDDMLIISNDMNVIFKTKRFLTYIFKMKDLGLVDTILRIKVKRHNGGYELSETHYIEKVIDKFKHLHFKKVNTSFDPRVKLKKNYTRVMAQFEYASVIYFLMYLMKFTRPDITFAVSKMSKFIGNPNG